MTEHVWSYQSNAGHLGGSDLTGYKVEATDGSIGKVDKHSDEAGDAYLVVDTGVWIFGKEVLLPASTVIRIDVEEETVYVHSTKEQIKSAPEFHRDKHLDDVGYRQEIGTYYSVGGFGGRII
ncbi:MULTISPECIES: PRC-barrel domain-containing protein [unclassified Streptomyces]|uniref:PRC-barrel domain-containing protein n=1 Tax=unclassified Streptomyces TaxID=2593676 RepID=UPI000DC7693E|nr:MULTISPECIES: PRC-barrel domain-containing protein [unclassified Streptomyces]AWZ07901.1 PRC-barrel domain containing protein [Streptomyces sp. ICC4]AWZ15597.1 PRC-barrel domain containing protein [Streptomyces sp. ICC1]